MAGGILKRDNETRFSNSLYIGVASMGGNLAGFITIPDFYMKELIKRIQRFVGVKDDGDLGPISLNAIADKLGIEQESNKLVEIA